MKIYLAIFYYMKGKYLNILPMECYYNLKREFQIQSVDITHLNSGISFYKFI